RSVIVQSGQALVDTSKGFNGNVVMPANGSNLNIKVYNDSGAVVKTLELGEWSAGSVDFIWDGVNNAGDPVASGNYTFVAEAMIDGEATALPTFLPATVNSVTLGGGEMYLNLAGMGRVPLSSVQTSGQQNRFPRSYHMSFNVALSALPAANTDLAGCGNNIAHVATTGFKGSRAEFADVYSASILGTGGKVAGAGVRTAAISQQFTQGNINNTGNSLDLAVNGNGFFALSAQGQMMYTRAGEFGTDKDGFIVNSGGYKLQGYGINSAGDIVAGQKVNLQLDSSNVAPKATTQISETLNLDSSATAIAL